MSLKQKARALKQQIHVVYLAARHPATPWYVKLLAAVIVAYAFSPIDLVPDFVPVLGYLDDVILLPLGIALLLRLTPDAVLAQCRAEAAHLATQKKPVNYYAAAVIIAIWLASIALCLYWLIPYLNSGILEEASRAVGGQGVRSTGAKAYQVDRRGSEHRATQPYGRTVAYSGLPS